MGYIHQSVVNTIFTKTECIFFSVFVRLSIKEEVWKFQNSNTSNLVFKIPFLAHYLSHFMTLLPGDIISTGTPPGVGLGIKPDPIYIKPGDIIELGMDGLGSSKQVAKAYSK